MSTRWNPPALFKEIENRLGYRMDAEKSTKKLNPPHLLSNEGKKTFDEVYKKQRDVYLEHCLMETYDMRLLIRAMHVLAESSDELVDYAIRRAEMEIKLDPEIVKILDERAEKEAEARAKAESSDKKQGEIKGQKKIDVEGGEFKVKDDGSEAEAASECTTKKYLELPDDIEQAWPIADDLTDNDVHEKAHALLLNGDLAAAKIVLLEYFGADFVDETAGQLAMAMLYAINKQIEYQSTPVEKAEAENTEPVAVLDQVDQVKAQGDAPAEEVKTEAPALEQEAEKPKKGTAKIVAAKKTTGKKKNADLAGAM